MGWFAQLQDGELPAEVPRAASCHHVQCEMHIWWPDCHGQLQDIVSLDAASRVSMFCSTARIACHAYCQA